MARNVNGEYNLPVGNPAIQGTIISSDMFNRTMEDIRDALSDSLSRSGLGGMLDVFLGIDGAVLNPSFAFINSPSSGMSYSTTQDSVSISVGGVEAIRVNSNGTATLFGLPIYGGFGTGAMIEKVILTSGQTSVQFTGIMERASFHIIGDNVDSGRLIKDDDIVLDIANRQVELTRSYPEGSQLVMTFEDASPDNSAADDADRACACALDAEGYRNETVTYLTQTQSLANQAENFKTDAYNYSLLCDDAVEAARTAEANAAIYAQNSLQSKGDSETARNQSFAARDQAEAARDQAQAAVVTVDQSVTLAQQAVTDAEAAANTAEGWMNQTEVYKNAAHNDASSASADAVQTQNNENNTLQYRNTAQAAAQAAGDSETAAAASASSVGNAEANCLASALRADEWANKDEDSIVVDGRYSAFHWAKKAEAFAAEAGGGGGGGETGTAEDISTDAVNFDAILNASDVNVQLALEKIDDVAFNKLASSQEVSGNIIMDSDNPVLKMVGKLGDPNMTRIEFVGSSSKKGHISASMGIPAITVSAKPDATVADTVFNSDKSITFPMCSFDVTGKILAPTADFTGKITSSAADVSGRVTTGTLLVNGSADAEDMTLNERLTAKDMTLTNHASIKTANINTSVTTPLLSCTTKATLTAAEVHNHTKTKTLEVTEDMTVRAITASGAIVSTGDVTAFSDRRVKTNILPIVDALKKVEALNGYTFDRTDLKDAPRSTGVIAQELQEVLPEAVREGEDGMLSVAYGNIVGLLIESVKELSLKVKELEAKV